ncbi:hypothetical protein [Skermanella stibiiresistens]|uniref:hypothetical protein n=1 Tax=Skermanella stibiiresistens TaxID=913326 RepID=UPI0012FA2319|nr:hypothetical protein [Skermanella stibiiresistens]
MNRIVVLTSLAFLSALLCSTIALKAAAQGGTESAAQAIAEEIITVAQINAPLQPCNNNPIVVFTEGPGATELLLKATRGGYTPIQINIATPTAVGSLPPSVAETLNRLQRAGGTVITREKKPDESLGQILSWITSGSTELISSSVKKIIGAGLDTWASSGLRRYQAIVNYRSGPSDAKLAYEVFFECRS